MSSVRSSLPMLSRTVRKAVCLSLLICAWPSWLNGEVALLVSGSASIRLNDPSIACLFLESVTFPVFVWKTIGFLPFCWGGKRSASTSVAAWLSVPGSSRLLLVFAPTDLTSAPTTIRTSSQPSRTTHFL